MPIDPMTAISIALMVAGGLGSLFGGDDEAERLLKERLKGIDPKILEEMRRRARGAIGNQGEAERVSTQQRLGRSNAPVAKQEEIADKIRSRQFGAIGEAIANIDFMNEQYKQGALSDFAAFSERQNANQGQGFANLFGAGFGGLMQSQQMEELEKLFKGGSAQFQRSTFGPSGLPPQGYNYFGGRIK